MAGTSPAMTALLLPEDISRGLLAVLAAIRSEPARDSVDVDAETTKYSLAHVVSSFG
jgi:hypothetical protein